MVTVEKSPRPSPAPTFLVHVTRTTTYEVVASSEEELEKMLGIGWLVLGDHNEVDNYTTEITIEEEK